MSEANKYDRSYNEQSVKLALEIGVKRASEELKVPYGTLYEWVHAAKNGDLDIEEQTPENAMSLAEDIRQLRSEVKWLNKVKHPALTVAKGNKHPVIIKRARRFYGYRLLLFACICDSVNNVHMLTSFQRFYLAESFALYCHIPRSVQFVFVDYDPRLYYPQLLYRQRTCEKLAVYSDRGFIISVV